MFDNICTLPLSADVFAQAVHPANPIFSVGLSSGHVKTFRLPPIGEEPLAPPKTNGRASSISSSGSGRRLSETGFDTIDTIWQTRRHKGSCRALAFSSDGTTIFSAGTDGVVKAASAETGRVTSKIVTPTYGSSRLDAPSVLNALSPQNLLLGTDTGRLHVYDLRAPSSAAAQSSRPSQTIRPHAAPEDTSYSEPLTSLTPLPPTASSTSGTSRSWITTSGSTVAVSDLRKGVVTVSLDQGDVLLSSACVSGLGLSKKRRRLDGGAGATGEKILVGGAQGTLTLWDRGQWDDQTGRVVVHRGLAGDDDGTVEAIAAVPDDATGQSGGGGSRTVAVGLGTGEINFVRLRGGGGENFGSVRHDETGVDGVATLGFDVFGRLISGGGQMIKVWHTKAVGQSHVVEVEEDVDEPEDSESDVAASAHGDSSESDQDVSSDEDSDDSAQKPKKRKKGNGNAKGQGGTHGIAAFAGID